jgi:hypothetical protein
MTNGYVESICSISEGQEDAVYALIRRTVNGSTVRYVERLNTRQFTDQQDAFFVDSGCLTAEKTPTITHDDDRHRRWLDLSG